MRTAQFLSNYHADHHFGPASAFPCMFVPIELRGRSFQRLTNLNFGGSQTALPLVFLRDAGHSWRLSRNRPDYKGRTRSLVMAVSLGQPDSAMARSNS